MKHILLTTYHDAYLYHGGGERELLVLHQVLNESGFIADLYGPDSRPIHDYDIVIHFSLTLDCGEFIARVRRSGSPMLLWPNLWFTEEVDDVTLTNLQRIVDQFDIVVFKSLAERVHFEARFNLRGKPVVLIRPGVMPAFADKVHTSLFSEVYGIEDYIFWPGIIEPRKNQLTAIRALLELEIPLVFSGDVRDQAYFAQCKSIANSDVHFLPEMPFLSEIHLSALSNCRLFLEVPNDFPGVSAIEAAVMGRQLVITDCAWSREVFGEGANYVPPASGDAIRSAVMAVMESPEKFETVRPDYSDYLLPGAYVALIDFLKNVGTTNG